MLSFFRHGRCFSFMRFASAMFNVWVTNTFWKISWGKITRLIYSHFEITWSLLLCFEIMEKCLSTYDYFLQLGSLLLTMFWRTKVLFNLLLTKTIHLLEWDQKCFLSFTTFLSWATMFELPFHFGWRCSSAMCAPKINYLEWVSNFGRKISSLILLDFFH